MRIPLTLLAVFTVACDDGDGTASPGALPDELTEGALGEQVGCDWLTSEQNCWHDALARIDACAPDTLITDDPDRQNVIAQINAERTQCTYEDGTTVRFPNGPLPQDVYGLDGLSRFGDYPWAIEMRTPDGRLCVRWFEESPIGVSTEIELADARYRVTLGNALDSENAVFNHHCPDGTVVHSRFDETLECWMGGRLGVASFGPYLSVAASGGREGADGLQVVACDAAFD
jgi:hypothetical protein